MFKRNLVRGGAVLGIAVLMITSLFLQPAAQTVTRSEVNVAGLITASPGSAAIGQQVRLNVELGTFIFLNLHQNFIFAVEWDYGDGTVARGRTIDTTFHTYFQAGTYRVQLKIFTPTTTYTSATFVGVNAFFPPNPPATIGTIEAIIASYDFDGNNRLSDSEFFAMIDAWVAGRLADRAFFVGVDVWVKDGLITDTRNVTSASGAIDLTAKSDRVTDSMVFAARGGNVEQISVHVYDTHGNLVYEQKALGNKLSWNYLSRDGRPVANGVYYYLVKALGPDGVMHSAPRAIQVLR